MAVHADAVVVATGCALVALMVAWSVVRVRHWRRLGERRAAIRCHAADVRPGDVVFVWAYVVQRGEWRHGTVAEVRVEPPATPDADAVALLAIRFAEGASCATTPFAPAWVVARTGSGAGRRVEH